MFILKSFKEIVSLLGTSTVRVRCTHASFLVIVIQTHVVEAIKALQNLISVLVLLPIETYENRTFNVTSVINLPYQSTPITYCVPNIFPS